MLLSPKKQKLQSGLTASLVIWVGRGKGGVAEGRRTGVSSNRTYLCCNHVLAFTRMPGEVTLGD